MIRATAALSRFVRLTERGGIGSPRSLLESVSVPARQSFIETAQIAQLLFRRPDVQGSLRTPERAFAWALMGIDTPMGFGQTRISRKGRPQLRRVLNELVLPLVRRGSLYGDYYHRKTGAEKMEGTKAMTAVSRKLVKMIWGWSHSKGGFDAARVFICRAQYATAA